ncbi:hypothetical protein [Photorhabdus asymbiotica]|uniref:hypothetical protein n=1 Tax=Photorhabdus asymbiotica TaxID=291112 RepID=UPI0038B37197
MSSSRLSEWQTGLSNDSFYTREFHDLDAGLEFYTPQTTQTADSRRLMIGRMNKPDDNLQQLRGKHTRWQGIASFIPSLNISTAELIV